MTDPMTDPQTIASKLTKAQREQILLCVARANHAVTGEPCCFRSYASRETTANVLVRLGISLHGRSGMSPRVIELTPLGLSVRTHLEKEPKT